MQEIEFHEKDFEVTAEENKVRNYYLKQAMLLEKKINALPDSYFEGKKEAESKKAEMIENAKKEVDNMILNGKKVLESEKAKILEEAKSEIVGLVVKATEKLLESKSDEKFDSNLMSQIKKM